MPPAMKMQHLNATSPTPLSPPDVATAPIADTPDDAIDTPAIAPSPKRTITNQAPIATHC
jgi:hypothetical protein